MKTLPINYGEHYYPSTSFKGYTAQQICAELCKGACCNHGTPMNATLKKIVDKLCAQYHRIPDDLKSAVLIKAPVVKWVVNTSHPDVIMINKLANTYIDAIARETNPQKIEQLTAELDKLNKRLVEINADIDAYAPVTNPEFAEYNHSTLPANAWNVCMFKDHGKTNLCTIYNGIKTEEGVVVDRPKTCYVFGSDLLPCPWHQPDKYVELYKKFREFLPPGMTQREIQQYIAEQFNLNKTFEEKIWKPYLAASKGI